MLKVRRLEEAVVKKALNNDAACTEQSTTYTGVVVSINVTYTDHKFASGSCS